MVAVVQPSFANRRSSRFLFSGLDGLYRERSNADTYRPLACAIAPLAALSGPGPADLHLPMFIFTFATWILFYQN